jgi:aminodeoxychorismate synthase component I
MTDTLFRLSATKKAFLEAVKSGATPPLYAPVPYASPASLYPSFSGPGSFLLESVKGPFKIARYSFIGFSPYAEYKIKDGAAELRDGTGTKTLAGGPLGALRTLTQGYRQKPDPALPPFQGGGVGLLSYDFVHYLERAPATTKDDLGVPDAHFLMADRVLAFDHLEKKAWAVFCPGARRKTAPDWPSAYDEAEEEVAKIIRAMDRRRVDRASPRGGGRVEITHDTARKYYTDMVKRAREYIAAGDIFQANLSLRVSASIGDISPWRLYSVLRDVNPAPFAAFMDFGDYQIVSSSPERLVRVCGGSVETRPIAGTRPRGKDAGEDMRMRDELLLNEKERAEHIMLIDLERNDLGRVCDYGSVEADELMITEDYSHVMHIVSNVKGALAPGKTPTDVIRAVFPGGTITGVPKVRCMEIIDELEPFRRGPYTGSVGYLGFGGSMDLNIVIRTFTIKGQRAYVQAGAGIVADSDPEREYLESLKKAEALMKTLQLVSS